MQVNPSSQAHSTGATKATQPVQESQTEQKQSSKVEQETVTLSKEGKAMALKDNGLGNEPSRAYRSFADNGLGNEPK